jgi:DNA-binding transcriptional MerR regulator
MEKAAEAFRTISEVAEELDVPKHVLRFWEGKFTQIKPMKRGGGRRYYRPEDVELLRGIRRLLHDEGYTIKGVQKVIKQSGVEFVKQVWREGMAPAKALLGVGKKLAAQPATGATLSKEAITLLHRALRELESCQELLAPAE